LFWDNYYPFSLVFKDLATNVSEKCAILYEGVNFMSFDTYFQ
jgi:hypothetical protein